MIYKVWDRIRIRQWDDMEREFWVDSSGSIDCRSTFAPYMKHLCWRTATIRSIIRERCYLTNWSDKDNTDREISTDMIELIYHADWEEWFVVNDEENREDYSNKENRKDATIRQPFTTLQNTIMSNLQEEIKKLYFTPEVIQSTAETVNEAENIEEKIITVISSLQKIRDNFNSLHRNVVSAFDRSDKEYHKKRIEKLTEALELFAKDKDLKTVLSLYRPKKTESNSVSDKLAL